MTDKLAFNKLVEAYARGDAIQSLFQDEWADLENVDWTAACRRPDAYRRKQGL